MAHGHGNQVEREIQTIGMAHTKAGQKLLRTWKLPTLLCDAIRFHHTPKVFTGKDDPLISMVAMGDMLAGVHGDIYERSIGDDDFQKLIEVVGLDVKTLDRILVAMDKRIEETRVFLQLASDGLLDTSSSAVEHEPRTVAMICTDELRMNWADQVLNHFGHQRVGMKEFFTQAGTGDGEVDLVILDPLSLTAEQLQRVAPVLKMYADNLVVFDRDEGGALQEMLGRGLPIIPVAFSRQDLEQG